MDVDLLNDSCLPEKTILWILSAENAAILDCPLGKLGCQVIAEGCLSDRNGRGASGSPGIFRFKGIERARLAVPQGGAMKIPKT